MTLEELIKVIPVIKQIAELGLGIVGNLTVIGIAVFFVAHLSKLLKNLTVATESIVKTNEQITATLGEISKTFATHEERSINIQAGQNVMFDKLNELNEKVVTAHELSSVNTALSNVGKDVSKVCGKLSC